MWIDALCINQDDLDERADQVCFMADIYETAWRVVIWLGEDKGHATIGKKLLERAGYYARVELMERMVTGDLCTRERRLHVEGPPKFTPSGGF